MLTRFLSPRRSLVSVASVFFFGPLLLAAPKQVSFKTPDGTSLVAIYSAPSAGKGTIVLLHGLASGKGEWTPLIDVLAKNGFGALAYDMRAPGTPWQKLVDDVGAAVRYLEEKQHLKRQDIFVGGASLGANVSLRYATLTGVGKAVLLLSPGINYQGLTTEDAVVRATQPVLIVASESDTYAYTSSVRLASLSPKVVYWTSRKAGHGVQMFDDDLLARITQWLTAQK